MEASQTDVLFYDIFSVFVQFPAVTRHGSLRFCWVYHSYIVPTARSTSRVEYIPSTYRIFVKFEDSSSSTISRKCATQWLNSSVSTLSAYLIFFLLLFCSICSLSSGSLDPLDVREASGMGLSATIWSDVPESSEVASDKLSALAPCPGFPRSIGSDSFSEGCVATMTGVF